MLYRGVSHLPHNTLYPDFQANYKILHKQYATCRIRCAKTLFSRLQAAESYSLLHQSNTREPSKANHALDGFKVVHPDRYWICAFLTALLLPTQFPSRIECQHYIPTSFSTPQTLRPSKACLDNRPSADEEGHTPLGYYYITHSVCSAECRQCINITYTS